MTTKPADNAAPPFAIFRARDAKDYGTDGPMTPQPISDTQLAGGTKMMEAGMLEGSKIKLLYSRPGMSLTYCWFKSGFPLPRHSHSADCLYFIITGTLKMGTEVLGAGDGFFLGTDVPYTYVPGEDGVEVLEFRTNNAFDIKMLADNPAYWEKALAGLMTEKLRWPEQTEAPSGLKIGN